MAHFARVQDGVVTAVIVAEQKFINNFVDSDSGQWIQTSYNTVSGVHTNGGTALRKNFAGVGFTYDETKDAFIAEKPFPSWTLNETTCLWESPVAYPEEDGANFEWNEKTQTWDAVE